MSLHWNDKGLIEAHDFMTSFLNVDEVLGRPVGLAEATDGTIYLSDDYAGLIYRLVPE